MFPSKQRLELFVPEFALRPRPAQVDFQEPRAIALAMPLTLNADLGAVYGRLYRRGVFHGEDAPRMQDGRVAFQGGEGPFGFKPAELEAAIERELSS